MSNKSLTDQRPGGTTPWLFSILSCFWNQKLKQRQALCHLPYPKQMEHAAQTGSVKADPQWRPHYFMLSQVCAFAYAVLVGIPLFPLANL